MSDFQREQRYIVIKLKDLDSLDNSMRDAFLDLCDRIEGSRLEAGKRPLQCVVIEDDWNCYEQAWELVEREFNAHNGATPKTEQAAPADLVERVTKAILFADCGNTTDWQDNTDLGKAAIKAMRPEIQRWRDDAFSKAADIAERYQASEYVVADIRSMIATPPPQPQEVAEPDGYLRMWNGGGVEFVNFVPAEHPGYTIQPVYFRATQAPAQRELVEALQSVTAVAFAYDNARCIEEGEGAKPHPKVLQAMELVSQHTADR